MTSYGLFINALVAAVLLSPDEDWIKKCMIENCPLAPPWPWNPYAPLDPHEFLHFSVVFCFCMAITVMVLYLTGAFKRERPIRHMTEEEVRQMADSISKALPLLEQLQGAALRRECRLVVTDLLSSVDFCLTSVREYYIEHNPQNRAIVECLRIILHTGTLLRLRLDMTRTMLLFSPLLSRACRHTVAAAKQYDELMGHINCFNLKTLVSPGLLPVIRLTQHN